LTNGVTEIVFLIAGLDVAMKWFPKAEPGKSAVQRIHVADSFEWPKDFTLSRHPGLLACELIRTDDKTNIVMALWRDNIAIATASPALIAALGGTPIETGTIVDAKGPPAWWPKSTGDALIKIAAVIGAVTVVVNILSSWFALPNVAVAVQSRQPINASVGLTVTFTTLVLNNSRSISVDSDVSTISPDARDLQNEPRKLSVPGGGQGAVTTTAIFDQSGDHSVTVATSNRAGRFMPTLARTATTTVKAWPLISRSGFTVQAERTSSYVAFMRGEVATGIPGQTKLECQATVNRVPRAVRFLSVSPSVGGGTPLASQGEYERTITIKWQVTVSRPFEWQPVTLNLDANAEQAPAVWNRIAEEVDWTCEVKP
jgi:hypothetical protein